MASGFRSLLAFWNGSVTPPGGVKSMLAPWLGGAGAQPAGYASMMGFWMGGGSAIASATVQQRPQMLINVSRGGL